MKSFGLMTIIMFATLLDMAPIGGSCRDKHSEGGRIRNTIEKPIVTTGDVLAVESAYQFMGTFYENNLPPYQSLREYGIEYAEKNDKENMEFTRVKASDSNDGETFSVTLDNLKPSTLYQYRAYLQCTDNDVYYGQNRSFMTKDDK